MGGLGRGLSWRPGLLFYCSAGSRIREHPTGDDLRRYGSAAIPLCGRKRAGKLKHIRLGLPCIQNQVHRGELKVHKVPGEDNPVDLMTKHLGEAKVERVCAAMHIYSRAADPKPGCSYSMLPAAPRRLQCEMCLYMVSYGGLGLTPRWVLVRPLNDA